jgi:hypothetical protein
VTLRVIGAGVGRTATTSLKLALERLLGAPCYHMVEVFSHPEHFAQWTAAGRGEPVDWHALLDGYVAAVDWPSASFWPELAAAFPDAIIVLSTRESASWWKSASETIFARPAAPETPMGAMVEAAIGSRFTTSRDPAVAMAAFDRWNANVRATAPRDRLVDWTMRDGWAPLCKALGVAIPDDPFPHVNTTDEFKARQSGPRPH